MKTIEFSEKNNNIEIDAEELIKGLLIHYEYMDELWNFDVPRAESGFIKPIEESDIESYFNERINERYKLPKKLRG